MLHTGLVSRDAAYGFSSYSRCVFRGVVIGAVGGAVRSACSYERVQLGARVVRSAYSWERV